MKKNHSVTTDSRSDSAELPIRLYRAISDVVRHLDDQRARVEHVSDLFSENIEAQRIKLRDYCDKLMFTDPVGYGKKAEDLLWRKVFYEIVGTVKRLNKTAKMDLAEMCMIQTHLQSGIGYYHHLIMKLQSHFRLDLRGIVDFPLLITDCGLKKDKNWWNGKAIESSALEWAHHALHRCLIYLGDISRYLSDLQSSYDHNFAQRYYVQALNWKPECGMPHNQLGTLATNQNYGLDSTYYYMRCLCCTQKFEGAEGNLLHLMENNCKISDEITKGNSKVNVPNVKKLIVAFIHISYSMFYDKINPQINQLYADAFMTLEACMAEVENNKNKVQSSITEPTILNDDMLFKMMVISIMCVQQLKAKNSPQIMGGVALCLTLMSQLVQCALKRIEAILPPRLEPSSAKKNSSQLRRRRRRKNISTSDLSEDENDSVYSMDSDISEEDLIFDECNDSEEEMANGKPVVNGILDEKENANTMLDSDPTKPWRHSLVSRDKTFQHILQLCQDGFLFQAIKIGFHWIFSNQVFLKSCGTSSIPFLTRLVEFLNHLSGIPSLMNLKEIFDDDIVTEETVCTIPLPEDVAVRGLSSLQLAQANLNWDYLRTMPLKPIDEVYTRIVDMLRFGKLISKAQISILTYDEEKQWFGLQADKAVAPKNGIVNHRAEQATQNAEDQGKEHKPLQVNGFRTAKKKNGVISTKNINFFNGKESNKMADKSERANDKPGVMRVPKINGVLKKDSAKESVRETSDREDAARVEKLMQNMGELWLRSEVSQLEDKTRKVFKDSLPPYLVPDAEAFLNHPSIIKKLISAKKFIVLIPSIVVSALDECKQSSSKVRDTIRWLEWQLRKGERNIRIQRTNEHQFIPYIKYPKKKDKEAWMFMQVVECCNYLCNQSTGEKNPELVTLLTGSKALLTSSQPTNGYSHISVAKSAGINVEHIETFFSKWKSSSKSHG